MRRLTILATVVGLLVGGFVIARPMVPEVSAEAAQRGLAEQLRYVGRDPMTGIAAPVDDRFIAEVEKSIERYGKDAGEPVPPPPAEGTDITWLSVPAIGIAKAPIARFGLDAFGRLEVPQDAQRVGWNPAYNTFKQLAERTVNSKSSTGRNRIGSTCGADFTSTSLGEPSKLANTDN